jgi:hypothetical protein
VAVVTDASTAGSCTSGGGSAVAFCRDSGAAWVPLGDGGGGGGGSGDVVGPASAVDSAVALWDTTSGKLLKGTASAGNSGQALVSNGTGVSPSFQTLTQVTQQWFPLTSTSNGPFSTLGTGYTNPTITANSNPSRPYGRFPANAGSPTGVLLTYALPGQWDSSGDTVITFKANSNPTTGNRTMSVETACVDDGETIGGTITFSTAQTVVINMATDNFLATGSITLDGTSLSGCSAGDVILFRITRSDAGTGEAHMRLIGLKYREFLN